MDMNVHSWLGKPACGCEEIYCRTWRPSWSLFAGKPNTEAIIKMKNGVFITYNGSWAARGNETSWDGNFTITGEKGCLTLDANNQVLFYEHQKAELVILNGSQQIGCELALPAMKYTETEYGFHMFMDCLEQDKTPETMNCPNLYGQYKKPLRCRDIRI